jgi:hypothetical protein
MNHRDYTSYQIDNVVAESVPETELKNWYADNQQNWVICERNPDRAIGFVIR